MDLPSVMPEPPPVSGGVVLRAFREADVDMLLDLATDPYVPMTGTLPPHADRGGALGYVARQHDRLATGAGYSFCVALASTDVAVGQAGLWLAAIGAHAGPRRRRDTRWRVCCAATRSSVAGVSTYSCTPRSARTVSRR